MTKRKKGTRRTLTRAEVRRQQQGGQILEPGVWIDREGALHFSVPDILKARGIPATPASIEAATEALRGAFAAAQPDAEIVVQDEGADG